MSDKVPFSVVVATTHPWPEVERCLDALREPVERLGGEILIMDGDGQGVHPSASTPQVRVVTAPGESVFALRARGLAHARGDIILVTEDHCVPVPYWCDCLLDALCNVHPDKAVVAGATQNGSFESPVDRGSFLVTGAEVLPPLDSPPLTRIPPPNNFAIRASAAAEAAGAPGKLELEVLPRLWHQGSFALHRDAHVTHIQEFSFLSGLSHHYANGRASAGLSPTLGRDRSPLDWLAHPARLVRPIVRALAGKDRLRGEWAALPFAGAFAIAHVVGEAAGVLRGPGSSPGKLS